MLANAIMDAKTIFFIQYSWKQQKWRSMFMLSPTVPRSRNCAGPSAVYRVNDTTDLPAVLEGL
jgi:hypothetical protein